jgi:putative heme-binding domain-containing protein
MGKPRRKSRAIIRPIPSLHQMLKPTKPGDKTSSALNSISIFSLGTLLSIALLVSSPLAQEVRNPLSKDPKAAKAGEFEFRINCAFCHGLGARGGGRGPDLTRARKRHGDSDTDIFQNISQGIPGTVMPANGTNGQGVGMTDDEIWQIIAYLRSVQVQAPAKPVGNAVRGKQLFYGDAGCSSCHMVGGEGGRLGPDLTAVGTARTVEALVESVRSPSKRLAWGLTESTKEFAVEYQTVTVVTSDGHEIKGITLNEDQFSLQMMDKAEQIRLFEKDKLRSIQKSRTSLMPTYDQTTLNDQDLNDVLAYLLSVGTK